MTLLNFMSMLNPCLVLIFGFFISVYLSGGWTTKSQRNIVYLLCCGFLVLQAAAWFVWDEAMVEWLYPLIIHFPIVLILVFVLKKDVFVSIVSVLTSYLCCQIPHWTELVVSEIGGSVLMGEVGYTVSIAGFYILLRRYFVRSAHAALTYSKQTLILFGILPFIYYLFDYATTVYTEVLYIGFQSIYEFFPAVLAVFYVLFLTAYHAQMRKRTQAELHSSMLNAELKQSLSEMESLRQSAVQTAVYQHDMRHHLNMIDNLITVGKADQALSYISSIRKGMDSVTPKTYCENEALNLLCSSFASRAERHGIELRCKTRVPNDLPISDTELCSVVSNGLENALHAVSELDSDRWIEFYCDIRQNKLLLEVKNPYRGEILMSDDIPVSQKEGHGYGCYSIKTITERHGGICIFQPEDEIFILRIAMAVRKA